MGNTFRRIDFKFAVKLITHTSPEKVIAKRRRKACGEAVARLKEVASIDASRRNELVVSIMKQYIGDRFDKMAGSLTPDDCRDMLISAVQNNEIADKFRQTMEYYEAARYTSMDVKIDPEKIKNIIELMCDIEKKSKK